MAICIVVYKANEQGRQDRAAICEALADRLRRELPAIIVAASEGAVVTIQKACEVRTVELAQGCGQSGRTVEVLLWPSIWTSIRFDYASLLSEITDQLVRLVWTHLLALRAEYPAACIDTVEITARMANADSVLVDVATGEVTLAAGGYVGRDVRLQPAY